MGTPLRGLALNPRGVQVTRNDVFTARLLEMYKRTHGPGAQQTALGLHRSDYLLDVAPGSQPGQGEKTALLNREQPCSGTLDLTIPSTWTDKFLQVELNTIASSFGCVGALTTRLHRYVWGTMRLQLSVFIHRPTSWGFAGNLTCRTQPWMQIHSEQILGRGRGLRGFWTSLPGRARDDPLQGGPAEAAGKGAQESVVGEPPR